MEIIILDKRLNLDMLKPATGGSAGIDLYSCIFRKITLCPGDTITIKTGVSIHIKDRNYAGFIYPRSGLGSKGIVLGNLTGVIDAYYQGEIIVNLWNRHTESVIAIEPMMRIAQLVIQPILVPTFNQVDEFSEETDRGSNGFGSSGQ